MVIVDIDSEEYNKAKVIVLNNRIKYPSIRNYINKALKEYNDIPKE